ncbi:hypothetical protein Prum_085340 [Phytohabitans rumicis]|uniref:Uncharacterized protein n=1 Tax=Phytohabitans rumicis TaxID=1076125 RepID=A0A6V8LCG6_9ACTN|nr:hypothetical protein Prum_085340 [Phytohabitans rumicis]
MPSALRVAPLLTAIGGLPLPVCTYARNDALKPQSSAPPVTSTGAAEAGATAAIEAATPTATAATHCRDRRMPPVWCMSMLMPFLLDARNAIRLGSPNLLRNPPVTRLREARDPLRLG